MAKGGRAYPYGRRRDRMAFIVGFSNQVEGQKEYPLMTASKLTSKWKIHLLFAGALLAVVVCSLVMNMLRGERFLGAAVSAVKSITLSDLVVAGLRWGGCALHQPKDEWDHPFTTLGLDGKGK